MRLIGRPLLLQLAEDAGEELRGAVCALAAEIDSADWGASRDIRKAFPNARIEEHKVFVELDDRHCAVIIVNYERSVAMVEYAGAGAKYGKMQPLKTRKGGRYK